jgi:protein-tyrosine phosphatase
VKDLPDEQLSRYFEEAYEFIEKSEKVFVHCAQGKSRSATIVISYLIKKNKMDFQEAYDFVKSKRPCINPNNGFIEQLKNMAARNKICERINPFFFNLL